MLICQLCPHHCELESGEIGFCRARQNDGGHNRSLAYGRLTSIALDPIEKKPLVRFHPGSLILSLGSFGCNLRCPFCQNYEISQAGMGDIATRYASPEDVLQLALQTKEQYGNIGVAFTYNEPLVNYEYILDCAKLLKEQHLAVVLVTNGQLEAGPLKHLLPYIDAMNIDLKGFTQDFYDWLGGDFATTKQTIELSHQAGVHIEITTLVIPGKNDSTEKMANECRWLENLSPDIPLHLSRYFPRWHTQIPMTPRDTLIKLQKVAQRYLNYVYLGNI